MLAITFTDKTIKIYDSISFQKLTTIEGNFLPLSCFSSDGKYLVSRCVIGYMNRPIKVWDVMNNFQELHYLTCNTNFNGELFFSSDCKYLALINNNIIINLWDCNNNFQEITNFKRDCSSISYIDFVDIEYFSCRKYDANVKKNNNNNILIFDKNLPCKEIYLLNHGSIVTLICFSNNSKYLASTSADNIIKIWKIDTFQKL